MRKFKLHGLRCCWASVLIMSFALVLVPQGAQTQADFSSLLAMLAPAVVHIETPVVGFGSGFVVEHRSPEGRITWGIVTACHVVLLAPRTFGDQTALPSVLVTFRAWEPKVQLRAAVVKCDVMHDAALLMPLDANGHVTTLLEYFQKLAEEKGEPRLRSFPRLWFGDGQEVGLLEPVFVIGYPGPFSELNIVQGWISGRLPVPYILAEDGGVYRAFGLIVYDGAPEEELDLEDILQIQILPALHLGELAVLAQMVLDAGHGFLLLSFEEPLKERITGWDVIRIEDGIAKAQERHVVIEETFFGPFIEISPRLDRKGAVSFEREFWRTDASITSGHSGAPVLNLSGQVIGMMEWGLKDVEGGHFANPADVVQNILFETP